MAALSSSTGAAAAAATNVSLGSWVGLGIAVFFLVLLLGGATLFGIKWALLVRRKAAAKRREAETEQAKLDALNRPGRQTIARGDSVMGAARLNRSATARDSVIGLSNPIAIAAAAAQNKSSGAIAGSTVANSTASTASNSSASSNTSGNGHLPRSGANPAPIPAVQPAAGGQPVATRALSAPALRKSVMVPASLSTTTSSAFEQDLAVVAEAAAEADGQEQSTTETAVAAGDVDVQAAEVVSGDELPPAPTLPLGSLRRPSQQQQQQPQNSQEEQIPSPSQRHSTVPQQRTSEDGVREREADDTLPLSSASAAASDDVHLDLGGHSSEAGSGEGTEAAAPAAPSDGEEEEDVSLPPPPAQA